MNFFNWLRFLINQLHLFYFFFIKLYIIKNIIYLQKFVYKHFTIQIQSFNYGVIIFKFNICYTKLIIYSFPSLFKSVFTILTFKIFPNFLNQFYKLSSLYSIGKFFIIIVLQSSGICKFLSLFKFFTLFNQLILFIYCFNINISGA